MINNEGHIILEKSKCKKIFPSEKHQMEKGFDRIFFGSTLEYVQEEVNMEIGKQIKTYRNHLALSQEDLAEKIFVTRQTISNWENDKNYPDIHSLVLLSSLFDVSLDILVKGDFKEMKDQIKEVDIRRFRQKGIIFSILLLATTVTAVPLFLYLKVTGVVLWGIIACLMMYYAIQVEKLKKTCDIQTYKEIVAFMEGKRLDEIEFLREQGKRPYQAVLCMLGSGIITFILCMLIYAVLH